MRKRLNQREKLPEGSAGRREIEQIFDHQIEVAKSWEVKIVGRDEDGVPIKVASGADSTKAADFVFGLIGLRKLNPGDERIGIPREIDTSPGRSLLDIAADIYRHRLISGQMTEGEFAEMVKLLLSVDQAKMALLFKLMGKNIAGKSWEDAQALLHGTAPAAAQPSDLVNSPSPEGVANLISAVQCAPHEDVIADQASPKGCDTASHAPVIDEAPERSGSAAPTDDVGMPTTDAPAFVTVPDDEDDE